MFKNSKKTIFSFGASNAFFMGISFLLNLVSMKFLDPADMGKWQLISTVSVYLSLLSFGVINGVGREIPFNLGKKKYMLVNQLYSISLFASLLVSFLSIFILLILNKCCFNLDFATLIIAIFYIVSVLFQMLYVTAFRSLNKINILAISYFIMSFLTFFIYPAVKYFDLNGFIFVKGFVLIVPFFIMVIILKKNITFDFKFREIKNLVNVGFPIMLVGISFQILSSVDRYILIYFFDSTAVGYYSLSIYALTAMSFFPKIITTIFYPKMSFYYGENSDGKIVEKLLKKNINYNLLTSFLLGLILYVTVPLIVRHYLERYIMGIGAMKISIVAFLFLNIGLAYGNYLNVVKKQKLFLLNIIVAFFINLFVGVILAKYTKLYLNSVAFGTLFSFIMFAVMQYLSYRKIVKVK